MFLTVSLMFLTVSLMFLTVSLAKSKGQSLKYATSMQTGCKDLRKFQFEAIVQLLKKNMDICSAN